MDVNRQNVPPVIIDRQWQPPPSYLILILRRRLLHHQPFLQKFSYNGRYRSGSNLQRICDVRSGKRPVGKQQTQCQSTVAQSRRPGPQHHRRFHVNLLSNGSVFLKQEHSLF